MSEAPVDPLGPIATEAVDPPSPISSEVIAAAHKSVAALWKRIEKRAPDNVRARVTGILSRADLFFSDAPEVDRSVRIRLELSKDLEDLSAELRGRRPWVATFYRDGRLAIVRAQDPITIRGAVDHARIELFFDRYVRRAEEAYERMQYFLGRAGALLAEDKKVEKKPWEQPYIQLDTYRELIWGKVARSPLTRRE
jgi:hypothetical protein